MATLLYYSQQMARLMTQTNSSDTISPRQLLTATLVTALIAGILLVTVILPAEFDVDPLKTGELLGITGLSEEAETVGALNSQTRAFSQDEYTITLAAYESVEYKYRLEEGASLLFEWDAEGELLFDLHGEIDGVDPQENSPSFDQRQSSGEKGSYTAPFSGIHGWYWENRSSKPVTLTLRTAGFYSKAIEFQRNHEKVREF